MGRSSVSPGLIDRPGMGGRGGGGVFAGFLGMLLRGGTAEDALRGAAEGR